MPDLSHVFIYSLHSDWLVVASKVLDTETVTRLSLLFALIMAKVSLASSGTPKSSLTSFADERREEAILYMMEADGTRDRPQEILISIYPICAFTICPYQVRRGDLGRGLRWV